MLLNLISFSTDPISTLSALLIDGKFECYALEDTFHHVKIPGHTRIPEGLYNIQLRQEGSMDAEYRQRFGSMHRGMLWLMDVPNFKWVYIHCGNTPKDTEGCILVGDNVLNNQIQRPWCGASESAYTRFYPRIVSAIDKGEGIWIRVSRIA